MKRELRIPAHGVDLQGVLTIPEGAEGAVIFTHGNGSARHSPRSQVIARTLHDAGLATLLVDLMTPHEDRLDRHTRSLRFDVEWLAERVIAVTHWVRVHGVPGVPIGYLGASTGAAAALVAAAREPYPIGAIVARSGRPDLAGPALEHVRTPTLFIVAAGDDALIEHNRDAYHRIHATKVLEILDDELDEHDTLDRTARRAASWFVRHLADAADTRPDLGPASSHF